MGEIPEKVAQAVAFIHFNLVFILAAIFNFYLYISAMPVSSASSIQDMVVTWSQEVAVFLVIYIILFFVICYFIPSPQFPGRVFKTTLQRVVEQKSSITTPQLWLWEKALCICCVVSYGWFSFTSPSDSLFHLSVVLYILFHSEGRYNTLSSSFKHASSKITFVFLIYLHTNQLHNTYMGSQPNEPTLKTLIFLFQTDNKLGNHTHMVFVYALLFVKLFYRPILIRNLSLFGCAICFFIGDRFCKDRQNEVALKIHGLKTKNEQTITNLITKHGGVSDLGSIMGLCSRGEHRDARYETIEGVRYYYNFSHYTIHLHLSPLVLLCELALFTA